MIDIRTQKIIADAQVSTALHAAIVAAIGNKFIGVKTDSNHFVSLLLDDTSLPSDQDTATQIAANFDTTSPPDPIPLLVSAVAQAAMDTTSLGVMPIDGMTVAQVDAWIVANVTNLATAQTALRYAARYLMKMRKELNLINQKLGL